MSAYEFDFVKVAARFFAELDRAVLEIVLDKVKAERSVVFHEEVADGRCVFLAAPTQVHIHPHRSVFSNAYASFRVSIK